jgi:cysteine-S-conjugate beta-lyase
MRYNFDKVINRIGTGSIKWDGAELVKKFGISERFDEDSIPLFVADMDFPCPQPVVDALQRCVDRKIYGYSTHLAHPAYFEAIQGWFKRLYNWEIDKEHIVYSTGTVEALYIAVKAFTKPGEGVILQSPVYRPFYGSITDNGRKVVNNPLIHEDGYYRIDFEDLDKKASDPKTKLFLLCSPHNPVGRIWNRDELGRMADICQKHDVMMVTDEIHGDLIRQNATFIPLRKVSGYKKILTLTAINKTFNVAGLHCTNAIIEDQALRQGFSKELGFKLPSPFAMEALIAAYNEGQEWLDQLKVYIDGNFEFLRNFLVKRMPEVRFSIPDGTYMGWMDFRGYGLDPKEVHRRIYDEANVILEDGEIFGVEGAGFQRICLPTPRSILEEALERIAKQF